MTTWWSVLCSLLWCCWHHSAFVGSSPGPTSLPGPAGLPEPPGLPQTESASSAVFLPLSLSSAKRIGCFHSIRVLSYMCMILKQIIRTPRSWLDRKASLLLSQLSHCSTEVRKIWRIQRRAQHKLIWLLKLCLIVVLCLTTRRHKIHLAKVAETFQLCKVAQSYVSIVVNGLILI